jgi:hypothetical protein
VLDTAGGIAISTAGGDQSWPTLAFDGTNYLVAWHDSRAGSQDIYGTRVSPTGAVLDPGGIPISTAANNQAAPAVAFDDTNYLVVWQDSRSGDFHIYGARVTPGGTVIDPAGIQISASATGGQNAPAIAYDHTNYLVAWEDSRSIPVDIYGARVTTAGTVLDPSGIAIATAAGIQAFPTLAADDANFLVAWVDSRSGGYDIYGARVSQAGAVLDPSGIAISTATSDQTLPAVAFDGTNYLLAWWDNRSGAADIYGARVTQAGAVLEPAGIPISAATGFQQTPALGLRRNELPRRLGGLPVAVRNLRRACQRSRRRA